MTTWYTATNVDGAEVKAFSVRPDLWPPGSVVDTVPMAPAWRWLATWGESADDDQATPLERYAVPGAAEALVLAGRVVAYAEHSRTTLAWVVLGGP